MVHETPFTLEDLFNVSDYLYFLEDTLRDEDTPAQVTFLEDLLALSPGQRVLDLGCGHGRHTLEFARRGYHVTGVDAVSGFLAKAQEEVFRAGVDNVEFVHGDIGATVHRPGHYNAAVCLFDAFGFLDEPGNLRVLANAREALVPHGRIALDLRTREFITRMPPTSCVDKPNGDMMIDRHHFDILTGRLVDTRTTVRAGVQRTVRFSVRIYAFTEIKMLLEWLGFSVVAAYGGYQKVGVSAARSRTLVIAERLEPPSALIASPNQSDRPAP